MPRVTPSTRGPASAAPSSHFCRCPCGAAARAASATTPMRSAAPSRSRLAPLLPRTGPATLPKAPRSSPFTRAAVGGSAEGGGGSEAAPAPQPPAADAAPASPSMSSLDPEYWDSPDDSAAASYCIIESRESVKDFAGLGVAEVRAAISARRNKIYFLMEEVRRLRIQERLKQASADAGVGPDADVPPPLPDETTEPFPSALPFFPPLKDGTLSTYRRFYGGAVAAIILFGGLLAPVLEVKLGVGGTSYADFIRGAHLPAQLADVDPIVASFCGGAVGVLTALLIVEVNNAAVNAANRCAYCAGTGYVTCGACGGAGVALVMASGGGAAPAASSERCATCSGTGKVACIACLCTGKKVAREGDPRLDPFS